MWRDGGGPVVVEKRIGLVVMTAVMRMARVEDGTDGWWEEPWKDGMSGGGVPILRATVNERDRERRTTVNVFTAHTWSLLCVLLFARDDATLTVALHPTAVGAAMDGQKKAEGLAQWTASKQGQRRVIGKAGTAAVSISNRTNQERTARAVAALAAVSARAIAPL